jgi:exopolysaccharide biosynthesis polyprenyl glycosylphosphotransferase
MYARTRLFERLQLGSLQFLATYLAAMVAMWVRHAFFEGVGAIPWRAYLLPALLAGLIAPVVLARNPSRPGDSRSRAMVRVLQAVLITTCILLTISFFYRGETYSRGSVFFFIPLAVVSLRLAEQVHQTIGRRIKANSLASRRMLLVGLEDQGQRIVDAMAGASAIDLIGYLDDSETPSHPGKYPPRCGSISDLARVTQETRVDLVLITSDSRSGEEIEDLIGVCMANNTQWLLVPPLLELLLDRIQVDYIGELPVVSERGNHLVGHDWFIKRAFDVVVSAFLLVVLSPLLLLATLVVRLSSPGPVIFKQQRVGIGGNLFDLLKFRTMFVGSDQTTHQDFARGWITGHSLEDNGSEKPVVHKMQRDPRITPVGRLLRASSIDELPQLWNVLRGDMSLVGPRPPIPYELRNYTEWHRRRLAMPPGLTGLWQVGGRNHLSFEDMVRLDLDYIEQWSIGLDIGILLRTVPALVLHRGS